MRILFIVEHFPCISETFVLNQVTGLIDRGHQVEVYPVGKPVAPVVHPDFVKYNLPTLTWSGPDNPPTRLKRLIRAALQLPTCLSQFPKQTLRALNPFIYGKQAINLYLYYSLFPFVKKRLEFDVVHCHFGDKGVLSQIWREIGMLTSPVSVVFHAHEMAGIPDERGRAIYKRLFKSNALILPISNHWRELLVRWGAKPQNTIVHHMGVDCEKINYDPKKILSKNPIWILSVCRLTEMKGIEYSIRAVAQLSSSRPELRYTIVGDGPLRNQLQQLVACLGMEKKIFFAGPQPQDKVWEYLRKSHMFLAPSVTDSSGCTEGIPVAIMEAMAAGVPTVATRHAGIPELINDRFSGLLVKERDVIGLVKAIEELISDPILWGKVTHEGRSVVEKEFNILEQNRRLEDILLKHTLATKT